MICTCISSIPNLDLRIPMVGCHAKITILGGLYNNI